MLENTNRALQFIVGMDYEAFSQDEKRLSGHLANT
jgi:uncharacterized protein with HEPN domain